MNPQDISRFKTLFEQQRKQLIHTSKQMSQEFHFQKDDLLDDADLTSCELEASMRLR